MPDARLANGMRPLATALVETAALSPGERVLDVACGTGVVARLAGEQVGAAGHVTGLDVNPGMLAVARSVSSRAAIEWREGTAEDTQLPDAAYDAVLCQMGLQFFAAGGTAMAEFSRVLVPGGRLVANVPGPMPPLFQILQRGIRDHVSPEIAKFMSVVFSLDDARELEALIAGSGFREVSVRRGPTVLRLPPAGGLPLAVRVGHAARRSGWQPQRARTRDSDARRSRRMGRIDPGRCADPSARRPHRHGEARCLDHGYRVLPERFHVSVTLSAVSDLALDSTFAGCRIEAVAGRGGMGVVYRATQLGLDRAVALKLVAPERAADANFRVRFDREARVAAAIEHPNVIPVYGAGEEDGRLYLLMRWVPGTDLQALIGRSGRLDHVHAAAVVAQVAAGLDAAHAVGLVHRDVKPANVLLGGEDGTGHVYLSDFGLTLDPSADTRVTDSGEWFGTVDFMAPEQFEGDHPDARTDVYALGCVLNAALTGEPPYPRGSVPGTILAHLHDPPPRPSATAGVPPAFDAVVARALAKRPHDRYRSAGELAKAALAAAGGLEVEPERGVEPRPTRQNGSGPVIRPPHKRPSEATEHGRVTARLRRASRRPASAPLLAAGTTLVAGVAIAALAGAGPFGTNAATGALTEADVRDAVEAFATAYTQEDDDALSKLLASDVSRVTPSDAQRGRESVVREYRRQFAANPTERYVLTDVSVRPGGIGRASGRYVVSRSGRGPITGEVAFGVQREQGHPRVGLIAATPDR
jgi:SAM-dependent methyltransferase